MFLRHKILMDQAPADGSPSGHAASTPSTPQFTPPQGTGTPTPAAPAAPTPPPVQAPEGSQQSQPPTPPAATEVDLKGLEPEKVSDLVEFGKTHNLTKEQMQGLVDQRKASVDAEAQTQTQRQEQIKEVHAKWETELKSDPDFGGQNYDANIHFTNKVITEHFPSIGKLLTDNGKKLPPTVMKELNSVAMKLYGENEFVQGSAAPKTPAQHNPWDYYGAEQNK